MFIFCALRRQSPGMVSDDVKKLNVLVVDDDQVCRTLLKALLNKSSIPVSSMKFAMSLEETLALLHAAGVHVAYKSSIHQKFAVCDQKIVWYGSINLLSFGRAEESIMRLENPGIADELRGTIQK